MNDAHDNAATDREMLEKAEAAIEEERIAKLPRWTRDLIGSLEREIESQRKTIASLRPAPEPGDARMLVGEDIHGRARATFETYEHVRFRLGSLERAFGDSIEAYLTTDNRERELRLRLQADRQLLVYPTSTNVVVIALGDR